MMPAVVVGALPQPHYSFFEVGKQFRTPNFSQLQRKEKSQWYGSLYLIQFWCKHVNFLERANVEGEAEFLFTAYSVFTVLSREFKSQPRWTDPLKIVLEVALITVIFQRIYHCPPGLFYFILFYFILFYFILFYFILFHFISFSFFSFSFSFYFSLSFFQSVNGLPIEEKSLFISKTTTTITKFMG